MAIPTDADRDSTSRLASPLFTRTLVLLTYAYLSLPESSRGVTTGIASLSGMSLHAAADNGNTLTQWASLHTPRIHTIERIIEHALSAFQRHASR